jgi:hypothetical protein
MMARAHIAAVLLTRYPVVVISSDTATMAVTYVFTGLFAFPRLTNFIGVPMSGTAITFLRADNRPQISTIICTSTDMSIRHVAKAATI